MPLNGSRVALVCCSAALALALSTPVSAQGPEQKPPEQAAPSEQAPPPQPQAQPQPEQQAPQSGAADAAKAERKTRADQTVEAGKALQGPAANAECVWLGERVVGLMWRDDLDTAFRHLDLYDRFGCPGGHVQNAFRCVVRLGPLDQKSGDINARVHGCWLDPDLVAQAAPTPAPPQQGTNPR